MTRTHARAADPSGAAAKHAAVLASWTERDLAADVGALAPAYDVDEVVAAVGDVVASRRHPVLVGPSGVGKTAVVHELVRRIAAGTAPAPLAGKRVVQISIRTRAAALKKPDEELGPDMQRLVEAMLGGDPALLPFICDLDRAYDFDVESQLLALALRMRGPILAEGAKDRIDSMFEYRPELQQVFVPIPVLEPSPERAGRILRSFAAASSSPRVDAAAADEALRLAQRFLTRDRLPRAALDLLRQTAATKEVGAAVSSVDVIRRFCATHNVPEDLIDPTRPLDLGVCERFFRDRALGQDGAVAAVVQTITLLKAGLSDARRPLGAFLFAGPTGVGKTHLTKLLAEYMFGSAERLVRFNMADFAGPDDAFALFGHPAAGPLAARRGVLTQRLAGHPFAVLLFDELEKAHAKVHDGLLQLIDEGVFINGAGESVSCRSCVIVATTNAGGDAHRAQTLGFAATDGPRDVDDEIDRRLLRAFRFEFLNRFDHVVHFRPLGRETIRAIAVRELDGLRERGGLVQRNLALEVDESVVDWLTVNGWDPHFGARFLRRALEKHVATALARVVVGHAPGPSARVALSIRRGEVHAALVEEERPAERRATVSLPVGTAQVARPMDRAALLTERSALTARAHPLLRDLDERRAKASALLQRMNAQGFWDDAAAARAVLEEYRALDVAVRAEERLATPLVELSEASDDDKRLARLVEAAARALQHWETRRAEEGPAAAWLVVASIDPARPAAWLLDDLVALEFAWCERVGLAASVAALEIREGVVARVVIEVEGSGALAMLEMERGIHRARGKDDERRARIDVVPRGPAATTSSVTPMRARDVAFGVRASCRGRFEWKERGVVVELVGHDAGTLAQALADLERASPAALDAAEVARVYNEDGAAARDPRTGVIVARGKDAARGRLDAFLEGWRRRLPTM